MDIDYYAQYFAFEHDDWWFVSRRKIVFSLLQDYLKNTETPIRILDAGCGTGINLGYLKKIGQSVGVDFENTALSFCKMRKEENLVQSSINSLPFSEKTFDITSCLDVIEHIDDDETAISELGRVTKPGGLLILTVPAFQFLWSDHDVINHHKRRYRIKEIKQLLTKDFDIEYLSYYNTFLLPLATAIRFLKKLHLFLFPNSLREIKAENTYLPRSINSLFSKIFSSELFFLRRSKFPVGMSIICIAKRVNK